jgi:hypothetical protein
MNVGDRVELIDVPAGKQHGLRLGMIGEVVLVYLYWWLLTIEWLTRHDLPTPRSSQL